MTVAELIKKLQAMPQDAAVVIDMFSDCDLLDDDQPEYFPPEDKKMVIRNGKYIWYFPSFWPKDEQPNFVGVCHFPGN